MEQEDFVRVVIKNVLDVAIRSTNETIATPPGRRPTSDELHLSSWYSGLGESDKGFLNSAIREAADAAVFGFLCLLDGARSVGNGKAGKFKLTYVADGAESRVCPGDEDLHDIYSALTSSDR